MRSDRLRETVPWEIGTAELFTGMVTAINHLADEVERRAVISYDGGPEIRPVSLVPLTNPQMAVAEPFGSLPGTSVEVEPEPRGRHERLRGTP